MTSPATTDLSDAHQSEVQHCAPIFHDYGGVIAFSGPIATLKLFEDNVMVRAAVETPGEGRVLVDGNLTSGDIVVKRSAREGKGEADITVRFAGVTFTPGAWLYADADGIILANMKLA